MIWEDDTFPPLQRARALVEALDSRGSVKRLGAWLDDHGDERLIVALVQLAVDNGAEADSDLPGKKLLRRARGREEESRRRLNPIRRDEFFECLQCGAPVSPHGRTARDHCPFCLYSLHVDIVPGDRAADCGGLLEPVEVEFRGSRAVICYQCLKCGERKVNQAILDGEPADSWESIMALSAAQ
ncbi:MAG: RNHCP domain-containing protein [Proteobacteria bacterium]|jgi:hypothetical protein|nr:RNHCP domain-containing protein [Pseudomonadota bacterium]